MKTTLAQRGAEQTQVTSPCVFSTFCLFLRAGTQHLAFEAGYSRESVERFILERVIVD